MNRSEYVKGAKVVNFVEGNKVGTITHLAIRRRDDTVQLCKVRLEDGTTAWWRAWQVESPEEAQARMVREATDARIVEAIMNKPIGRVAIPGLNGVTVPVYR